MGVSRSGPTRHVKIVHPRLRLYLLEGRLRITHKLRLRRAARGSGEHRRETLRSREACRMVSKSGASSGVKTRRRRQPQGRYVKPPFGWIVLVRRGTVQRVV